MISNAEYDRLPGMSVKGSDGEKIGKVVDVYASTDGDTATFATVSTGLFGGKASFVPLAEADLRGDDLVVPYAKDQVKDAPRIDTDEELTAEEEDRLYDHYSLGSGGTATGAGGAAATGAAASGAAMSGTGERRGDDMRDDMRGAGTMAGAGTASDSDLRGDDMRDTSAAATGTGAMGSGAMGSGAMDRDMGDRDMGDRAGAGAGHDTSGPDTDSAMTRSEEHLQAGTARRESGRARLRKHVVTERETATVPVSHEEVRVTSEPITEANRGAAYDGPGISEEEHEVVLNEEVPVVSKETTPVERVRMDTERVTGQETVSDDVRKEVIETDGVDDPRR